MNPIPTYSRQTGLSLIELMIAITISVALLTGVVQIFANSKSTYRTQEALSRVSENVRFALDVLAQDISRANFWGCNTDAGEVVNNLNATPTDPLTFIDFAAGGIVGTDGGTIGPDEITVRGLFGPPLPTQPVTIAASDIVVNTDSTNLQQDMIVGLADCRSTDIFQISGLTAVDSAEDDPDTAGVDESTAGSTTIAHKTTGTTAQPGNAINNLSKDTYGQNSSLYRAEQITYQLQEDDANGGNGRMALFRNRNNTNGFPLISDVDDFQVVYGVDTDNDRVVNRYFAADAVGPNFANVISVRITLQVSSPEDNVVPTGRLARTVTTTIALRNQLP